MLIPFLPATEPHSEENRFEFQQQLEKTMKSTCRSIGRLIVTGQSMNLNISKAYFKETIIPFARDCLGTNIAGRVLRNYAILLYFVCQVWMMW